MNRSGIQKSRFSPNPIVNNRQCPARLKENEIRGPKLFRYCHTKHIFQFIYIFSFKVIYCVVFMGFEVALMLD